MQRSLCNLTIKRLKLTTFLNFKFLEFFVRVLVRFSFKSTGIHNQTLLRIDFFLVAMFDTKAFTLDTLKFASKKLHTYGFLSELDTFNLPIGFFSIIVSIKSW